jgi:hypothetical protein
MFSDIAELDDHLSVMWESNCHVHSNAIDFGMALLPTSSSPSRSDVQQPVRHTPGREESAQSEEAAVVESSRLTEHQHSSRLSYRIHQVHTRQVFAFTPNQIFEFDFFSSHLVVLL